MWEFKLPNILYFEKYIINDNNKNNKNKNNNDDMAMTVMIIQKITTI